MFFEIDKSERVKRYLVEWISCFGFRCSTTLAGDKRLNRKIAEIKRHGAMGVKVTQENEGVDMLVYRAATSCPTCGSDDVASDGVDFQDDCIVSDMGCNACDKEWRVLYEAKGVYER